MKKIILTVLSLSLASASVVNIQNGIYRCAFIGYMDKDWKMKQKFKKPSINFLWVKGNKALISGVKIIKVQEDKYGVVYSNGDVTLTIVPAKKSKNNDEMYVGVKNDNKRIAGFCKYKGNLP